MESLNFEKEKKIETWIKTNKKYFLRVVSPYFFCQRLYMEMKSFILHVSFTLYFIHPQNYIIYPKVELLTCLRSTVTDDKMLE